MKIFDYNEYLGLAGIKSGDIIDVASGLSSVKRFSEEKGLLFDANSLIDELIRIVGVNGTVLIRTFSWTFCKGIAFNIRETPSEVGVLGNVAIKRTDFRRTQHPIYSWMVYGKHQQELCTYNNIDAYGEDGIFPFLEEHHAKQLMIGSVLNAAFTIGHYIEVQLGLPLRKQKFFEADYYDMDGGLSRRRYSIYVKPLNIEVEFILSNYIIGEEDSSALTCIKNNYLYKGLLPISSVDLVKLADYIRDDYNNHDGIHMVRVNGIPGVMGSGVDWSTAIF